MDKIKLDIQKFAASVGAYKQLNTQGGSSKVYCVTILKEVSGRQVTFWMRLLCTWTSEPFEDYKVTRSFTVTDNSTKIDSDSANSKWPNSSDDWKSETRSVNGTSYKQYCQYYKKVYTFDDAAHSVKCTFKFQMGNSGTLNFLPAKTDVSINCTVSLAAVSHNVTYAANGGDSTPTTQSGGTGTTVTLADAITHASSDSTGTISVSYNANQGSGGPSSASTGTYTDRTTYTFAGWLCNVDSQTYNGGATYTIPSSDSTMTAQWTTNTSRYSNPSITLSSTTPTRTGYNFLGWSTSSTATTASYNPNTAYTFSANTVLYAVWQLKTYTISYSSNGGSSTPSSQTKTHGVNLTIAAAINHNNSTANGYTVTFNANGGSVSPTSKTAIDTTTYSFNGWKSSATGTVWSAGATNFSENNATTLTAQWNSSTTKGSITTPTATHANGTSTYTVTFNANNGTTTKTSQNSTATITYTANGWYTATSSGTKRCNNGASYTPSASEVVYQQWSSSTGSYSAVTLPTATECTRPNYDLLGWSTSSTATTATYLPGASYTPSAGIILYAVWKSSQTQVDIKINNAWVKGKLFIKREGEWVPGIAVYRKVNGVWVQGIN